ncbi:hypothetical protein BpHYR1_011985 [Brachionus plicatilis]|uniref:Uncharacterized protein n=1 Tax=Brachionus plicatilis TaxID=10195 RepID=A0A3M7S007_BRAPC|nr:hypothetical protein BpHYR1_011985 [Brachionus plicatilis]
MFIVKIYKSKHCEVNDMILATREKEFSWLTALDLSKKLQPGLEWVCWNLGKDINYATSILATVTERIYMNFIQITLSEVT